LTPRSQEKNGWVIADPAQQHSKKLQARVLENVSDGSNSNR